MKLIKFIFKILVVLFIVIALIEVFLGDEEVIEKESEIKKDVVSTSTNCTEYGHIKNCSINRVIELNLKLSQKIINCKDLYGIVDYKKKCKSTVELSDLGSKRLNFLMDELIKIPETDAIKKDYMSIEYGKW